MLPPIAAPPNIIPATNKPTIAIIRQIIADMKISFSSSNRITTLTRMFFLHFNVYLI